MTSGEDTFSGRAVKLAAAIVAAGALLAFLPAMGGEFVEWDDTPNFVENQSLRGLSGAALKWAFTTSHVGVWQPLSWLLIQAQYELWQLAPWGYHVVSLVFHAANSVLVFLLLLRLLSWASRPATVDPRAAVTAAGAAALLFAAHPLRAEVVAWASCQPYLPCALFFLLSALAHLKAQDGGSRARRWYWTSVGLYGAALMSKAAAVMLPAALLIVDAYPLRRLGAAGWFRTAAVRRVWWEKIPYVCLGLVAAALAVWAKSEVRSLVPMEASSPDARVAQAALGTWHYVFKTVLPLGLSPYYVLPADISLWRPVYFIAFVAAAAVTLELLIHARRRPALTAGWLSYLVVLAPNSGLVRIGQQLAADRYAYLSTVGLFAALAAGLYRLLHSPDGPPRTRSIVGFVALLFALLVALSWHQSGAWKTSEALWTRALREGGEQSGLIMLNWGKTQFDRGRTAQALAAFQKSAALEPSNPDAFHNMSSALFRLGRHDEALAAARKAVALNPQTRNAQGHLGLILMIKGQSEAAKHHLREALRQKPDDVDPRMNLGLLLFMEGNHGQAIAELEDVVRKQPTYAKARGNLGWAYYNTGRLDEALRHLGESARLEPRNADTHAHLALVLADRGQKREARAALDLARRLAPQSAAVRQAAARLGE